MSLPNGIRSLPPGTPYIGNAVAPPTPRAPTAAMLTLQERIAYHATVTAVDAAVTRAGKALLGSAVGSSTSPVEVFANTGSWPVGVRLEGDPITNTIRLNFYVTKAGKPGADDFRDFLSQGLGGVTRNTTRVMWVPPQARLFAQRESTWGTPDANDKIRVGIIDLQVALDPSGWPGNAK